MPARTDSPFITSKQREKEGGRGKGRVESGERPKNRKRRGVEKAYRHMSDSPAEKGSLAFESGEKGIGLMGGEKPPFEVEVHKSN